MENNQSASSFRGNESSVCSPPRLHPRKPPTRCTPTHHTTRVSWRNHIHLHLPFHLQSQYPLAYKYLPFLLFLLLSLLTTLNSHLPES